MCHACGLHLMHRVDEGRLARSETAMVGVLAPESICTDPPRAGIQRFVDGENWRDSKKEGK
jgi:hypothetical protein